MGWSKLLPRGDKISEPESWSNTKLDNLVGVELVHADKLLGIYGRAIYWQSDSYVADVVSDSSIAGKLVARRIERLIEQPCVAYIEDFSTLGAIVNFNIQNEFQDPDRYIIFNKQLPMWLIVEINTNTNKISTYTSKERI